MLTNPPAMKNERCPVFPESQILSCFQKFHRSCVFLEEWVTSALKDFRELLGQRAPSSDLTALPFFSPCN